MTRDEPLRFELDWRLLRSQVWYSYILRNSNGREIDSHLLSKLGESSKLQFKWANGSTKATRASAQKYEYIRGSLDVFDLAIFPLLELARFPKKALREYFKEYIWKEFDNTWLFQSDTDIPHEIGYRRLNKTYNKRDFLQYEGSALLDGQLTHISRNDSFKLASRGDITGFTAVLALVREAESDQNNLNHSYHFANLVRMLPTIAQTTPFNAHYHQLTAFFKEIHQKVPSSIDQIKVNWDLIEKQIEQGVIIPPWDQLKSYADMRIPQETLECAEVLV